MSLARHHFMSVVHVISALLVGYVILLGLMWWLQPGLVFHPDVPSRSVDYTPANAGLDFESVTLTTSDGVELSGWFVPGPGDENGRDSPAVLFLHGNAGNIGHRIETLEMIHAAGAATLIIDYRGFGNSQGHPTERGTYRDAIAAWRWLTDERGLEPGRIVIVGRSLGAAIAAWLAARVNPAGLVLEASFTSIVELGQYHYPWAPIRWISRFRYDTRKQLKKVRCPVLIAHGHTDEIVPYSHAEELARLPMVEDLLRLDGGHNDAMLISHKRYTERLAEFISQVTTNE